MIKYKFCMHFTVVQCAVFLFVMQKGFEYLDQIVPSHVEVTIRPGI